MKRFPSLPTAEAFPSPLSQWSDPLRRHKRNVSASRNSRQRTSNDGEINSGSWQMDRVGGNEMSPPTSEAAAQAFDSAVLSRYACTRFRRHTATPDATAEEEEEEEEGKYDTSKPPSASTSDPSVVRAALHCLTLAQRAPSGFNAQPYKVVLVSTPSQKEALARYCLGRNADRVRDSDCTAVFLADKEVGRTFSDFARFLKETSETRGGRPLSKWMIRKSLALVLLFSSGYPLPRFLALPISFCVRLGVATVSVLTGRRVLVPSLGSAETWSTKNTMLVAMTYMLGCASRGLATSPMEGVNAGGVRKALGIPRRYAVPLIVSAGLPYHRNETVTKGELGKAGNDDSDDAGMVHGSFAAGSNLATSRYPVEDVVFADSFGEPIQLPL